MIRGGSCNFFHYFWTCLIVAKTKGANEIHITSDSEEVSSHQGSTVHVSNFQHTLLCRPCKFNLLTLLLPQLETPPLANYGQPCICYIMTTRVCIVIFEKVLYVLLFISCLFAGMSLIISLTHCSYGRAVSEVDRNL